MDQTELKKTKTPIYEISRMLFSNMGFNFADFLNFNFAHFEIEKGFGLFWVKLQNNRLQIFISGIYKVLVSSTDFIFFHFVYKESIGQSWIKVTEWSIRLENFYFGARFTNYSVSFCSFWIIKNIFDNNFLNLQYIRFLSCLPLRKKCLY